MKANYTELLKQRRTEKAEAIIYDEMRKLQVSTVKSTSNKICQAVLNIAKDESKNEGERLAGIVSFVTTFDAAINDITKPKNDEG